MNVLSIEHNIVIYDNKGKTLYKAEEIRNKIILGDAIHILRKIENNIFNMVFIDPPYFLQLQKKKLKRWNANTDVEGVFDEWDKFSSFEEYDDFIQSILIEVKRVMKENATVWVIGTYHNIFRIGKLMQDLGFWILNDVIWVKNNPMPNWLGVRFTNATETLIWAVKDKKVKKIYFQQRLSKTV
jgi:DNA modification methylase